MIRKTLFAALALAVTLPASQAAAANAWTTTALNFRQGPGVYHPVITYLPHCAALTTYEWQDGWVRAEWDGQYGWVSGRYIADTNAHCQPGYQAPSYQAPAYRAPTYQAPSHGTGYTRRTY